MAYSELLGWEAKIDILVLILDYKWTGVSRGKKGYLNKEHKNISVWGKSLFWAESEFRFKPEHLFVRYVQQVIPTTHGFVLIDNFNHDTLEKQEWPFRYTKEARWILIREKKPKLLILDYSKLFRRNSLL